MADRIKGITIAIDGDTTGLSKALKGVNSDLKAAQNGLNDVNKLLKLDPGNVELLRQKQEYLNDAIGSTEEKLQKEKEALEQMKNSDGFDRNSEQAKALERQIVADEQALNSLKNQAKEFGSVGAQQFKLVGEKVQAVGDKMSSIGSTMTKTVTAPLVGVGAASIAAFKEVDSGMDIVVQKTGATGEALAGMQSVVENLATTIPTSFEAAGTAVGEVNTRFGLTGQSLEDLSKQFIQFAELNGTDVSTSIDQAQKALSAFGLGAGDAGKLLDRLNYVGQATGVSMDTLLSGLVTNSAAFSEMGLNIDQAATFMGQMEVSGADASTVMGGLQKALKNATADGVPLNQALSNLQNTILNGKDGVDGLTAAYDLFGKSGAQIYEAVKNGSVDFQNLGAAADDASGSVANTFEGTLDPVDQWTVAMNSAKVAGSDLGSALQTAALPILQELTTTLKELTAGFRALTPEQQQAIVKAAAVVAAIGPILTVGGKLVSGIGGIIKILPMLGGAMQGVGALVTGSLIPAIGGLISAAAPILAAAAPFIAVGAAIVGAGVLVYKNWDDIKAGAKIMYEEVSKKWDEFKKKTSETWNNIKQATSEKWNAIKSDLSQKWDNIKQKGTTTWNALKTSTSTVWTSMKSTVSTVLGSIQSTAASKLEAIKDKFTSIFDRVKEVVRGAIDKVKSIMNFQWSLPHLSLPHISISGGFSLRPPSAPHFSISWYKKAMQDGVLFTSPTVLQTPYGAKGFGESGAEIVLGLDRLRELVGKSNTTINVYGAAGQNETVLAEIVMQKLAMMQRRETAGAL